MSPKFDYTSMGFITFDALCRPVTQIPPGGDTYFVEDYTLAVSGAAGSAVIVAAKHGLRALAQRFTCWNSHADNIVFPASTATLAGADNRHVAGVPHVAMAFHPKVMAETLKLL